MSSYLIPNLKIDQLQVLEAGGVTYYLCDPAAGSYIIEGEETPGRVLELLKCTAVESPSRYHGVVTLTLSPLPDAAEVQQQSRKNYISLCSSRIATLVSKKQESLRARKSALADLQDKALLAVRVHAFKDSSRPEMEELFAAQYQLLRDNERLQNVSLQKSMLLLKTKKLCAQHPESGAVHELGEFLIAIDLTGGKRPVRWFNCTRRINGVAPGMHACNVYADGMPVLDEIQEAMVELVARLELSVVVELALQFIEIISLESLARNLSNWPLADATTSTHTPHEL